MKLGAIAVGLVMCAVSAHAAPIIHDNSAGTFMWGSFSQGGRGFEVYLSPEENNAAVTGRIWYIREWTPEDPTDEEWEAVSAPFWSVIVETHDFGVPGEPPRNNALKSLSHGDMVGPAQTFTTTGAAYTRLYSPSEGELASVGEQVVMGLRFQLEGATHYGYAVLLKTNNPDVAHATYQPIRWGWESTPNAPITVSVPMDCPADVDGSGEIGLPDLQLLLFVFGQAVPPGHPADTNDDGQVNLTDLTTVLFAMGTACP